MANFKTIAAIATPQAAGGIGIIRLSGEKSLEIADRIFKSSDGQKLCHSKGYRAHYGAVFADDKKLDECIALVFRAPHSYTGEDVVELSCHGGMYVLKSVLRAVLSSGAVPANAGEFTERAFMNGKMDLTQAQAVTDLIAAHAEQSANAALTALDGALSKKIRESCEVLIAIAANLSAWVDYPYDEIEELTPEILSKDLKAVFTDLTALTVKYDAGRAIIQGVQTAIIGRPNVGKSTLMNLLSGCQRSIVTEYAGTTRDVVEETVQLGDILLHLADTAGIRESDNPVESIGVGIAKDKMKKAQLVIAVFDGSSFLSEDDLKILRDCQNRLCVAVVNKSDLKQVLDTDVIKDYIPDIVEISASTGAGKEILEETIERLLGTDKIDTSSALLATERQYQNCTDAIRFVKEALDALNSGMTLDAVNVCIDNAIEKLLELTGEKASDAVIHQIFSQFCVGK